MSKKPQLYQKEISKSSPEYHKKVDIHLVEVNILYVKTLLLKKDTPTG